WNIGIQEVDRHHREFLDAINRLFAGLMEGDAKEKVAEAARMIGATLEPHFAEEENVMRVNRYADLSTHQQQHRAFIARFRGFTRSIEAGEAVDAGAFFDFVSDWFRQHATEHDAPLARFLRTRQAA